MSDSEVRNTVSELRHFDVSLPMVLLRARESAMRQFRPVLADHDLTEQQWRVLRALGSANEPIEVGALVERTSLLAPSLSRILVNLEERGLIDRQTAAHDLRRSEISLSDVGRKLVATVAPESEAVYTQIEERYGSKRLHALIGELSELTELLHATEEPT
ncbi:MAG: homoprotocatechuate degradation operon regulator HpaR [Acidimicrobiia bacterium]|nr:homoprotocatechuate degradation operon regulator HpaR [Acidimicrobiia bacterium]